MHVWLSFALDAVDWITIEEKKNDEIKWSVWNAKSLFETTANNFFLIKWYMYIYENIIFNFFNFFKK